MVQANIKQQETGLKGGTAGWLLLASLGVSFVISGDFAGWQFGLGPGGWGGMLIALLIVAVLYFTMSLSLAELSATLPSAGGGYRFASVGLGRTWGFITASAIVIEYAVAPAAIATFIGGYTESLGLMKSDWKLYLLVYAVFVAIHLSGAGEAMKLMLAISAIAVLALIIYSIVMAPHYSPTNLGPLFPAGARGIWAAFPFAIWFFLAVEGVPMAAEEAKDPRKDVPRAIIIAMVILFICALAMMFFGPGGAGTSVFAESANPLVDGLSHVGASSAITVAINYAALLGLIASFFSITYGYSRLIYSLSRDRVLPSFLSATNRRGAPTWALILPAILGFILTLFIDGDTLMSVAVCGAVISYALMMASHIAMRRTKPSLPHPYRTPGGIFTSSIALILSLLAILSTFLSNWRVGLATLIVLDIMLITHKLRRN
ncbi:MAG: ethanolamine permease [Corynebacterium sp.]|nr:ethanolamine permease [Corynebacterium sp.]